jgi:hypothetical protein
MEIYITLPINFVTNVLHPSLVGELDFSKTLFVLLSAIYYCI